jgi:hypothetical protein
MAKPYSRDLRERVVAAVEGRLRGVKPLEIVQAAPPKQFRETGSVAESVCDRLDHCRRCRAFALADFKSRSIVVE